MKILVTGGLGFVGHRVVGLLEDLDHDIVITDTLTNYGIVPQQELQALIGQRRQLIQTNKIYQFDVADQGNMTQLIQSHRPDVVVHLASFPRQKVVNHNPTLGSRTMSEGLLSLLEACAVNQVGRFVYVSSSMVYGDFQEQHVLGLPESAECRPIGQYGIMKLAGEWLVRDHAARTGSDYTILRPSAVYGPRDVEDRVVSKFLLTAMRGGEIQVNGSNESLDFTHVDDAAQGIVLATLSDNSRNSTYNITRGTSRSLLEAAKLAVSIAGAGTIQINPRDCKFPQRGQLDTSLAAKDFAFCPTIDIEQGFENYYQWLTHSFYRNKKTV
jgi:nucleoside-diphosphate-sugar epimerase